MPFSPVPTLCRKSRNSICDLSRALSSRAEGRPGFSSLLLLERPARSPRDLLFVLWREVGEPMTPEEIQAALEAVIYAADEPATLDQISSALGVGKTIARAGLDLLVASYQTDQRGIEVRKVAGGWKFYTKPQHHDVVRKFIKSLQPPLRLTMP